MMVNAAAKRTPTRATVSEASAALKNLLEAVEAGELEVSTPRDIALHRRLQGTLAGWEEVLGKGSVENGHTQ
jgi:hypothetical protein